MSGDHSNHPVVPVSRWTIVATLAVLIPLALGTLVALVWLWPQELKPTPEPKLQRLTGTITEIHPRKCPEFSPESGKGKPDPTKCGDARIKLDTSKFITTRLPSAPDSQRFEVGNAVVLVHMTDGSYLLSDHDRTKPLWLYGAAFALAVIAFGRWRGLTALVGLAITFVLLLTFVIPAILGGESPLLIAIVGSAAIMLAVLYLTHGFTIPTSMAVIGTLLSLTLTGLLSALAIDNVHLNGITDDSGWLLGMNYQISTEGLLLASIIIGSLGVLDDVTVTQAVTVAELAHANPGYGFRQLYRAATRVGRAHIASVINTIILAYAGASLPLLLLISIGQQPLGQVLTGPIIAQELVRSIVGTIGLIAAVPITTALTAVAHARRAVPREETSPARARHRVP